MTYVSLFAIHSCLPRSLWMSAGREPIRGRALNSSTSIGRCMRDGYPVIGRTHGRDNHHSRLPNDPGTSVGTTWRCNDRFRGKPRPNPWCARRARRCGSHPERFRKGPDGCHPDYVSDRGRRFCFPNVSEVQRLSGRDCRGPGWSPDFAGGRWGMGMAGVGSYRDKMDMINMHFSLWERRSVLGLSRAGIAVDRVDGHEHGVG